MAKKTKQDRVERLPNERELLSRPSHGDSGPRLVIRSLEGASAPFDRAIVARRALEALRRA